MRVRSGSPQDLGAKFDGKGTNFALFSADAERVELCLFDPGGRETARVALPERTDDVWHGYLDDVGSLQLYGYRVHGPYEPIAGYRFNSNKLLLDPYAKQLVGRLMPSDTHFGYQFGSARADLSFDRRDNAHAMPKCQVVAPSAGDVRAHRPGIPWEETILYEAHVKGLTMSRADVAPELRGTFLGLSAPGVVDHLRRLGVTAIELLPVHAFTDELHLIERGLNNYWGYNTLGFFSVDERYGPLETLRETVERLHDAGIEVILDVVYNHTAEGDQLGRTLSFRGIDNRSYYWLKSGASRLYENFTGCGNALNLTHPRVRAMVVDSLRYWVEACDVDGFRFDLASTLVRGANGFDAGSDFLAELQRDPVLSRVKLIAEPWDVGSGGYQVGAFPPGWSEWNDQFRTSLRRYWSGEGDLIGEVAKRMTGSADLFNHGGRTPRASINHVAVHDGFTLADLVSYARKHNEANRENNSDGSDSNYSVNCGFEGPTDDDAIVALRRQLRRNFLCCLFLALGVPLLLAGDEVGNSQNGNNNAYCQDNKIGWVDWSGIGQDGEDMTGLIAKLAKLRRDYPQLRGREWLKGQFADGGFDVMWLRPDALEMTAEDWKFPNGRFIAYVLASTDAKGTPLAIVLNAAPETIDFVLPRVQQCETWLMELNTAVPTRCGTAFPAGAEQAAPGRSVLVFSGVRPSAS